MIAEVIAKFRDAIALAGLPPPEVILADGKLHRYGTCGRSGDDAGWYVLYPDGIPAGAYGCWRTHLSRTWCGTPSIRLSADERRQVAERIRVAKVARDAERERLNAEARRKASRIWADAQPATARHPYLERKHIQPYGIRTDGKSLIVPMYDTDGLVSLQFIAASGDKRFLAGGRTAGTHYLIDGDNSTVYVAEGFATAASLAEATGSAVAIAFTAGQLLTVAKRMRERMPAAKLVIAADNDVREDSSENAGVDAATEAATLVGALLAMPELDGRKCDWNDVHVECGLEVVREGLAKAGEPRLTASAGEHDRVKKSAATLLVEMAMRRYTLGVSKIGEPFALPNRGRKVVSLLRGSSLSLRSQLAREYFARERRAPSQQALADALLVIEGHAREAEESELHLRVAGHATGCWLDLGDQTGRAIKITADGWTVEDNPPVLFKRTVLNSALPTPARGGSLDGLWRLLNVTESDRPLVAAWLVAALLEGIPHPVLAFFGEQGTGKTTAQRMLVSIIDPSPVPTRKPPRDPESWVTAAAGSWVVGLDNLSDVPPWLSDSICRAVTGDGDVRRKLYTDGEHVVFAYRRCICLNSIDLGATRGDLAERMLTIALELIPENMRLGEEDLWPRFAEAHSDVLGAFLDLAASVLRVLPSVVLARRPRMADFARVLVAVDGVLGTEGFEHYLGRQNELASDSLTGDPFVMAIQTVGRFEGTSGELLSRVRPEKPPRGWPANARAVTQRLRRQAPVMRKAGWRVIDDGGRNHWNAVIWTIVPPNETVRISSSPDSRDSQPQQSSGSEREPKREERESREEGTEVLSHCPEGLDPHAGFSEESESASNASQECGPSQDEGGKREQIADFEYRV